MLKLDSPTNVFDPIPAKSFPKVLQCWFCLLFIFHIYSYLFGCCLHWWWIPGIGSETFVGLCLTLTWYCRSMAYLYELWKCLIRVAGIVNKIRPESWLYFQLCLFFDVLRNYASHKVNVVSECTYKLLSNFERNFVVIRESTHRSALVITCALQKERFSVPEKLERIYTLHRFVIMFPFPLFPFIHICALTFAASFECFWWTIVLGSFHIKSTNLWKVPLGSISDLLEIFSINSSCREKNSGKFQLNKTILSKVMGISNSLHFMDARLKWFFLHFDELYFNSHNRRLTEIWYPCSFSHRESISGIILG